MSFWAAVWSRLNWQRRASGQRVPDGRLMLARQMLTLPISVHACSDMSKPPILRYSDYVSAGTTTKSMLSVTEKSLRAATDSSIAETLCSAACSIVVLPQYLDKLVWKSYSPCSSNLFNLSPLSFLPVVKGKLFRCFTDGRLPRVS